MRTPWATWKKRPGARWNSWVCSGSPACCITANGLRKRQSHLRRMKRSANYTRAIGRWKHYEQFLKPCLPLLQPAIEAFGY